MYRDEGFLQRLNRILSWSFPIGRWFGIEVRVYGALAIVPLIAASKVWDFPGIGALEVLSFAALSTVLLYAVVLSHEFGHAWMAWRYRIPTGRITLSPLGGLAHIQAAAPSPRAEIAISVAGPAVHLVWLAVFWPLSLVLPPLVAVPSGWVFLDPVRATVDGLVYVNVGLAVFNLLPFFPMDFGRVLRSILAYRMHPNLATIWAVKVGTLGAIGLIVAGLLVAGLQGGILIAIGLSNLLACRQERMAALFGDGPYGVPRDPWEADPDAWRYGAGQAVDQAIEEKRPGLWSRVKATFARTPRPVDRPGGAPDDDELDRLLEKVGEVGITGLSKSERAALTRASEARRR